MTTNTNVALLVALEAAHDAIIGMKVEAETAAQGDEQMMLEACEHPAEDLCGWSYRMGIAGKVVTNTCCDPRCVAPHHMLVTDRSTLGKMTHQHSGYASQPARRAKIAATQRRRAGKLTPEQAREIRTGTELLRDVAARMGISQATAQRIRTGQAWREYGSPFAGLMR